MTISSAYPYTLQNGTTADATQVMADFLQIQNDVNANAAHNGANSDITSLTGLLTPLSIAQGGTAGATAAAARANLAAAKNGANSDITSLSALATPLSAPQGGTGAANTHTLSWSNFNLLLNLTADTNIILPTSGTLAVTGAVRTVQQQVFTANGTYTPTAGMTFAIVELIGGGGGGETINNSQGGGGGAGQYSWTRVTAANVGASAAIGIGAGGAAGVAGGNTTFGALLQVGGGSPGSGGLGGGGGSAAIGGNLIIPGGWGEDALTGVPNASGAGANSHFGSGGTSIKNLAGNGRAGVGYGSGGSGGNSGGAGAGGAGASGLCRITEFINV